MSSQNKHNLQKDSKEDRSKENGGRQEKRESAITVRSLECWIWTIIWHGNTLKRKYPPYFWLINYIHRTSSCTHTHSTPGSLFRLQPCVSFVSTHVLRVCICVGVYERLHKLYQACLISPWTRVCAWFLALLQAHWRLSSHQDVPAGPRLGRVPGLSAACVLAECCQIIPHSWKVAWRRSYPSFTEKA